MRWPWSRRPGPRHAAWTPPGRVPDNDQVLHPGHRRSVDIIRSVMEEPTQPVPVVGPPRRLAPLLTVGALWRTRRSAA